MILALASLAAAASQVSPEVEARTRAAFDPARLAAAERLREADGSEKTLETRVKQAVTRIVIGEAADCVDLAIKLPASRRPDCTRVASRQDSDMAKMSAVMPAMVTQMRQIEQRAYAERYTVEEMDAAVAFLNSPPVRKIVADADEVSRDVSTKLRLILRTTLDGTPLPAAAPKEPQP